MLSTKVWSVWISPHINVQPVKPAGVGEGKNARWSLIRAFSLLLTRLWRVKEVGLSSSYHLKLCSRTLDNKVIIINF